MSCRNKKKLILKTTQVDIRCSNSSCKKPNLSNILHPKPKKPNRNPVNYTHCRSPPTSTKTTTSTTITTTDSDPSSPSSSQNNTETVRGLGRVGGPSVAVEKDSDDPYLDFQRSMLQMILENEIYSKGDLRELLYCFLELNAPYHHGVIVRAFTEIWDGVFRSSTAAKRGGMKDHHGICDSRDSHQKF